MIGWPKVWCSPPNKTMLLTAKAKSSPQQIAGPLGG